MGTTSSAPTRDSRGDLRQRAAQQAAAPRYNLPPGYADTPQPFNSTGNYAAPRYYGQPPPEPAPQTPATERTTRTTTIRNHVNLKKDSLKLIDDSNGGLICEFVFDANLPCWLSVFLAVNDAPREGSRLTLTGDRVVMQRVKRDAGLGQNGALKISKIDTDALVAHLETNTSSENTSSPIHSLVVRLECVVDVPEGSDAMDSAPAEPSGSSLTEKSQAQTTFATCGFSSDDDKKFSTTVTKQKIWVDGVSYELQEIFGIEHCSTGTPAEGGDGDGDGDDSGKECVVCMSEPRDTTALPCRHMCMCGACARMLRGQSNRCPICRTPVESLLEIKVATKAHGVGDVR